MDTSRIRHGCFPTVDECVAGERGRESVGTVAKVP